MSMIDKTDDFESRQDIARQAQAPIVTNTPRPGETPEQIAARSRDRTVPDPGLSALMVSNKQIDVLVSSMSDSVIRQLTILRDEIDDTIRAYESHRDAILDITQKHRETGESALNLQNIVASAMRELQTRISDEGITINKLVNGKNGA